MPQALQQRTTPIPTSPRSNSKPIVIMKNLPFLLTVSSATALGLLLVKLCLGSLQTDQPPEVMTSHFVGLQQLLTRGVPLVFLLLLAIQTWAYLRRASSGSWFVLAWLFFAAFTAIDYAWLSDVVFHHTKDTGTWQGGFNAMGIIGAALIGAGGLASATCYVAVRARRLRAQDVHGSGLNN